jgi:hypothetical protein
MNLYLADLVASGLLHSLRAISNCWWLPVSVSLWRPIRSAAHGSFRRQGGKLDRERHHVLGVIQIRFDIDGFNLLGCAIDGDRHLVARLCIVLEDEFYL